MGGTSRRDSQDNSRKRLIRIGPTGSLLIIFVILLAAFYHCLRIRAEDGIDDLHLNLSTEFLGVVASTGITLFFLDKLNERRDRTRAEEELKRRLVREAGSRSSVVTRNAIVQIRENHWLEGDDGILKGADLYKADFRGEVDLSDANLQGANLQEAVLTSAILNGSNLQAANLFMAHLSLSMLIQTDLRGSDLMEASLRAVWVVGSKLQGAYLLNTKITGPFFGLRELPPVFNTSGKTVEYPPTILPDGKEYEQGMSLERFTCDTHEEFPQTLKDINEIRKCMGLFIVGKSMYDE